MNREIFLEWSYYVFAILTIFLGLYYIHAPNPTLEQSFSPPMPRTFIWDFSHFWFVAFIKPPFSLLLWSIIIIDAIVAYIRSDKRG